MLLSDCLEYFGLDRHYTEEDLNKKYREKARILHPDVGGDEEKFKELGNRKEFLAARLRENGDPSSDFSGFKFGDDFSSEYVHFSNRFRYNFEKNYRREKEKRCVGHHLDLSALLVLSEINKTLVVNVESICPNCNGLGAYKPFKNHKCDCFDNIDCEKCFGRGRVFDEPCKVCKGRGKNSKSYQVSIAISPLTIPRGIRPIPNSDLNIELIVTKDSNDGLWSREGLNLLYHMPVNVFDVILKTKLMYIDLLDKKRYSFTIPEYRNGLKLKMKGLGLCDSDRTYVRGDLIIIPNLIIPNSEELPEETVSLLEKIRGEIV